MVLHGGIKKRLLLVAAIAAASISGQTLGPTVSAQDVVGSEPGGEEQDLLRTAEDFAKSENISVLDAYEVFEDASAISKFNEAFRDDERFGAIFATYEKGYQLHVRVTGDSADSMSNEIKALASEVGRAVDVRAGGASAASMWKFADAVQAGALPVAFILNHESGTITLFEGTIRELIPDIFPSEFLDQSFQPMEPPQIPLTGRAGADAKYYTPSGGWEARCTAGFMWGAWGATGFATSGHCPDANTPLPGTINSPWDTTSTFSEVCAPSGGDYQAHQFNVTTDPREHAESKNGSAHKAIEDVASTYWGGQPLIKIGLWQNSTSQTTGVVSGFGTINAGTGGDCTAGSFIGLHTSAQGTKGDSGGPILLLGADWRYRAGGMTATRDSYGEVKGQWVAYIPVASWGPSAHWCTRVNPCGAFD